jgi:signal peptidase I
VIGRRPVWTFVRLLILIGGTWFVFNYVLTPPIQVTGISMEPTYHDGQINFVCRLSYWKAAPQRGDVVGIHLKRTSGNHFMFLKRILGLPGETIAFVNGKLYINNQPLDEPYLRTGCDWNMPARKLNSNEYYVAGDNRSMPFEDHWHEAVSRQQIEGKVLFPHHS